METNPCRGKRYSSLRQNLATVLAQVVDQQDTVWYGGKPRATLP
jgi:hypothetical protein